MKKYEYLEIDYTAKGVVFLCTDKHKEVINSYAENGYRYVGFIPTEIDAKGCMRKIATVYKGNIIKNLIMDCQSYTKYRPNETTGGIFVSWRRKEELPTGA